MRDAYGIDPIERILREFACWAARRAWAIAGCKSYPCDAVVLAVEAYLRGEASYEDMRAAQERARGGLSGVGMCGVLRARPAAAAHVAAFHAGDETASDAVRNTVHHAAATAGFVALSRARDGCLTLV